MKTKDDIFYWTTGFIGFDYKEKTYCYTGRLKINDEDHIDHSIYYRYAHDIDEEKAKKEIQEVIMKKYNE